MGSAQGMSLNQRFLALTQEEIQAQKRVIEQMRQKMEAFNKNREATDENIIEDDVDFTNICNMNEINSLRVWGESYVARHFLKSGQTKLLRSYAYLKSEIADHQATVLKYAQTVNDYVTELPYFGKYYTLIRVHGSVNFILTRMGMGITSFTLPEKLTKKTNTFIQNIQGANFNYALHGPLARIYFEEYDVFRNPEKRKTLKTKFMEDLLYVENFGKVSSEVCSFLIFLVQAAVGRSEYASVYKKLFDQSGTKDPTETQANAISFYNNFKEMLPFNRVDETGLAIKIQGVTCKDLDDGEVLYNSFLEVFSVAILKVRLDQTTFQAIKFFTPGFFVFLEGNNEVVDIYDFDELIMHGPSSRHEFPYSFQVYQSVKISFNSQFLNDFMNLLVFEGEKLRSIENTVATHTNYNKIVLAYQQGTQAQIQQALPIDDSLKLFFVLRNIYEVYSYMRSAKLFSGDNSETATQIYKLIYDWLAKSSNVFKLVEDNLMTDMEVINEYAHMMSYLCYKSQSDGNCAINEGEVEKIYAKHKILIVFRIRYTAIRITKSIATVVQNVIKKYKIAQFEVEFSKLPFFETVSECRKKKLKYRLCPEATTLVNNYVALITSYWKIGMANDSADEYWRIIVGKSIELVGNERDARAILLYIIFSSVRSYKSSLSTKLDPSISYKYLWKVKNYLIENLGYNANTDIALALSEFLYKLGESDKDGKNLTFKTKEEFNFFLSSVYFLIYKPTQGADPSIKSEIQQEMARYLHLYAKFTYEQNLGEKTVVKVQIGNAESLNNYMAELMISLDSISNDPNFGKKNTELAKDLLRARTFVDLIISLERTLILQSYADIFVIYDFKKEKLNALARSSYQNPLIVLLNIYRLPITVDNLPVGDSDFSRGELFVQITECMLLTSEVSVSIENRKDCPWSHRKYAEIYYIYKSYLMINYEASYQYGFDYFDRSAPLVHTRIFYSIVKFEDSLDEKVKSSCDDQDNSIPFCIAWRLINSISSYIESANSEPGNPIVTAKNIKTIVDKYVSPVDRNEEDLFVDKQFLLLAAAEGIAYFGNDSPGHYDRFINFFDFENYLIKTNNKFNSGNYVIDKEIFRLQNNSPTITRLSRYLRLTYSKVNYSEKERFIQLAVTHILETDNLEGFFEYGQHFISYYLKIFFMFSRSTDQFDKLAKLCIDHEIFMQLPMLNDPNKDRDFNRMIENVVSKGRSLDPQVGKTKGIIKANEAKKGEYAEILRGFLNSEYEELVKRSENIYLRKKQHDKIQEIDGTDDEDNLFNTQTVLQSEIVQDLMDSKKIDLQQRESLKKLALSTKKTTVIENGLIERSDSIENQDVLEEMIVSVQFKVVTSNGNMVSAEIMGDAEAQNLELIAKKLSGQSGKSVTVLNDLVVKELSNRKKSNLKSVRAKSEQNVKTYSNLGSSIDRFTFSKALSQSFSSVSKNSLPDRQSSKQNAKKLIRIRI